MLTVISPAKRLNETPVDLPAGLTATLPDFATDAMRLARIARALSVDQLCRLMDISMPLGVLNRDRFKAFVASGPGQPAAFLFDGDTYAGLQARMMAPDTLLWAQDHLRILSGLYGLLRPLDAIQPYRLEMGSRLENPKGGDLYAYWGDTIARALNVKAAETGAVALINCASAEYFGAVAVKRLNLPVITPVFLEERGNEAKIVSFWAKKARGAMARHIAMHHLTDPADLRGFTAGGYAHRPDLSQPERMVFLRKAVELAAA